MVKRSRLQSALSRGNEDRSVHAMRHGNRLLFIGAAWILCLFPPTTAGARDAFVCQELKAAVSDAKLGFSSHKGDLTPPIQPSRVQGKTYLAKQSMAGATACSVVDVTLDEPKMRLRQTAYRCQFPGVSRLDKALRAQLTRCVAGEVDDPADPDALTIWVERVSSGEGYRAIEVHAQANAAQGLTLFVRQSVCTNKSGGPACEE